MLKLLLLRPIKTIGKRLLCRLLESQVRRLRARHEFKIVAVAGSVGKTSTKLAVAHALEPSRRVMYQTGNYNDRLTVPLVLFGHKLPGLFNLPAWLKILIANEHKIRLPYFYDIAVLELGTDGPGQIADFSYLQPDISIVTAVTAEHMEFFQTLDAVAAEELGVILFSKRTLVNADDTPAHYLHGRAAETYGLAGATTYKATQLQPHGLTGTAVELQLGTAQPLQAMARILGQQGVKIMLAAAATCQILQLTTEEIVRGLKEIKPFAGRMQILAGIKDSTLIDDTYNASPLPVMAGLDVLYATAASQRIALLGSMNELGTYSQEAHESVGQYCDPDRLDLVVTIGQDAEKYLAPAARKRGCTVRTCQNPYEAGQYITTAMRDGAVILAEGSQNKVFAEEALTMLLADPNERHKLVRQSDYWRAVKARQFGPPPGR